MLPAFVIIGAQKSSSTFVQTCLAEHPDIYLPLGETPFFESPDYENSDISDLEAIFDGRSESCVGIKRPNYLGKAEVPSRILEHLPDAKLIVVLRNPIDRAISAYFHNVNYGFIPPLNVEEGIGKLISNPSFADSYKRAPEIIEFGYYYEQLIRFSDFMENNQLLILLHEDIIAKPLESIQGVYRYLGVDSDYIPDSLDSRPQKVLYNLQRLKFMRYRNRFMYSYNNDRTRLSEKKMNLIDMFFAGTITAIDSILLAQFYPNVKPVVSDEFKKMLYELYRNDIESLESLIDRDLSLWKQ